jgi:hypothetical protein
LVHAAFAMASQDEPARIAVVHALATPHADMIERAIALCVDLQRQGAASTGNIWALAVLDTEQGPVIASAGGDGAVRSWRPDGTPGPLTGPDPYTHSSALAVLDTEQGPVIVSAGLDGAVTSWLPL